VIVSICLSICLCRSLSVCLSACPLLVTSQYPQNTLFSNSSYLFPPSLSPLSLPDSLSPSPPLIFFFFLFSFFFSSFFSSSFSSSSFSFFFFSSFPFPASLVRDQDQQILQNLELQLHSQSHTMVKDMTEFCYLSGLVCIVWSFIYLVIYLLICIFAY
jgi:hypothetical protein